LQHASSFVTIFSPKVSLMLIPFASGVADTLTHPDCTAALAALPIDPPTMAVTISVNDSPLAGLDGSKLTSRM
jgi:predicted membrane GTPase involved in stress response